MAPTFTGQWVVRDGGVVGDSVCAEIEALIATHFSEIGRDGTGWFTLYRDSRDGILWERSYPQGHLHGGGPPQLATVSIAEAKLRYGETVA